MNDRIEPDPTDPYASYHPVELPDADEPETTEIPRLRPGDTQPIAAGPFDQPHDAPRDPGATATFPPVQPEEPGRLTDVLPSEWTDPPRHSTRQRGQDGPSPLLIVALGLIVSAVILGVGFAVLGLGPSAGDPRPATKTSATQRTSTGSATTGATTAGRGTSTSPASGSATSSRGSASPSSTRSSSSSSSTSSVARAAELRGMPAGAVLCGPAMSGIVAARGNEITSCAFAMKVREAAVARGSNVTRLRVKSPVTGEIYKVRCTSGDVRVCTGGEGAVVYLR